MAKDRDADHRERDTLLAALPDAVVGLAASGRVVYANDAARDLGISATEGAGRPPDCLPPFWQDVEGRTRLLEGALASGGLKNIESSEPQNGGAPARVFFISARAVPRLDVSRKQATTAKIPLTALCVVATARDVTEKAIHASYGRPPERDVATGFLTRERFAAVLDQALEQAGKDSATLSLLSFDLDDFKTLNETHGLAAGDEYLRRMGERLREVFGDEAIFARLGGDEFVLLCPVTLAADAVTKGERLVRAFRELSPVYDGRTLHITASAGLALFPEHASRASDLILVADLALHEAKRRGRARFQLHDPKSGERDRIGFLRNQADQLRSALAESRVFPMFQPVSDVVSGRIVAVEVLARLREADGYVASPAKFLDAAERFGLVTAMDRVVIARAFDILATSRRRISADLEMSLNLSGIDFEDDILVADISRLARSKGIRPDRVTFEITETAALRDFGRVQNFTRALTGEGFRFALDDFGIGFSSFRYLRDLPMSSLKFDMSYIRNLPTEPESRVFVRGIAEICRGFGVKTVAEGVESSEILGILKELGVDRAQGHFIGFPSEELPLAGPNDRTGSGPFPRLAG